MSKSLLKTTLAYLPAKLLPALTGFVTAPILTRLFVPADYGNYALAIGLSDFLFALSCSGLGSGAIRFYAAYRNKAEQGTFFVTLFASVLAVVVLASAASAIALLALGRYIAPALYSLVWISIPLFIVQSLFTICAEVARAQERSKLYTLSDLATRYGGLTLGLLLAVAFDLGTAGMLFGALVATLLALPPLVRLITAGVRVSAQDLTTRDAHVFWRYSWPLALGNMAMWGLRLSDRYIISLFRPAAEVGLYSVAYDISGKSVDLVVALLLLAIGPNIINLWECEGRQTAERALSAATRFFLILCLPAATGLGLLARPLMSVFTAAAYHEGHQVVIYVAFSSFAWGLSQLASIGILVNRNTRRIAVNQIIAAGTNLVLNILLVPRFGFVVAGATTLVGYLVLLALQAQAGSQHLAWHFPYRTLANVLIATLSMSLIVLAVSARTDGADHWAIYSLGLSIVSGIPVYFLALWLSNEANESERAAIRGLWNRLVSRRA